MASFWDRIRQGGQQAADVDPMAPYGAPNYAAMAVEPVKQMGDLYATMRPGAPTTPEQARAAFWMATQLGTSAMPMARAVGDVGDLGMFVGAKSGKRLPELHAADDMIARGADPEYVRKTTGWFQGPDAQWRFEVPDDKAQIAKATLGKVPLRDMLQHDELYQVYPHLKDMQVRIGYDPKKDSRGHYDPTDGSIWLNAARLETPDQAQSTLLHELQHAVQKQEGFAPGAPGARGVVASDEMDFGGDAAWNTYARSTGEREARSTQARQHMDADDRRQATPTQMDAELFYPMYDRPGAIVPPPAPQAQGNIGSPFSQYYDPRVVGQPMGRVPLPPLTDIEMRRAILGGYGT